MPKFHYQEDAMSTRNASCTCGQLTLSAEAEPKGVSICHCFACQTRTGSPYGVQATYPPDAVQIRGQATEFVRIGDEGTRIRFYFCPQCGSTLYYQLDGLPFIVIPVGAFADPQFPAPTFSVYEDRQHSWVLLPEGMEHMA